MKNLFNLLERFSHSLNKNSLVKERIVQVIAERTRIQIPEDSLHLKNAILEINTSSVFKNEINLKEEIIKDELKELYKISISRILYK